MGKIVPIRSHVILDLLYDGFGDIPATLFRTRAGRELSRARYHTAETFFAPIERQSVQSLEDTLYRAGVVAQLGLSSHLIDVGFADAWCARHVGLCVADSLAYANATGLGHDCRDMVRLAEVLTPYCKWNSFHLWDAPPPDDGGFTAKQIRVLLRALLDRVYDVTGHPRPKRWAAIAEHGGRS
ncbi:hypothetical protein [Sphingomonas sp. UYEF23]|uniref:hypothetical protein n=1 Tax=Sphingomonas sp. UYEF23 TaxID=1756408 RepID=UPI0033940D0B